MWDHAERGEKKVTLKDWRQYRENLPPVANGGLLTNPATNLRIQNPAKLFTSAVGI
jgi:hypothetical protein